MSREQIAVTVMVAGLGLVLLAEPLTRAVLRAWARLGVEAPPNYARHVRFIGVVVTAIGFLLAMGWLEKIV